MTKRPSLALSLVFLCASPIYGGKAATISAAGSCAQASSGNISIGAGNLLVPNYRLSLKNNGKGFPPRLEVGNIRASSKSTPLPAKPLQQMVNIEAIALLSAITNYHAHGCNEAYFKSALQPAINLMQEGVPFAFQWKNISIQSNLTRIVALSATLDVVPDKQSHTATISVALDGMTTTSGKELSGMLPQKAALSFKVPLDSLSSLLESMSGRPNMTAPIPLTINSFNAYHRDGSHIEGHATGNFIRDIKSSSFKGTLSASSLDPITHAAKISKNMTTQAIVGVAKMVAHKRNGNFSWNFQWKNRVLSVNGIPVPL